MLYKCKRHHAPKAAPAPVMYMDSRFNVFLNNDGTVTYGLGFALFVLAVKCHHSRRTRTDEQWEHPLKRNRCMSARYLQNTALITNIKGTENHT